MLKKAVNSFLRRTHFWRDVGFDELSELYISNLLRSLALTIFTVFVPFYLYGQGYSAPAILAFYGIFFIVRAFTDIASGYLVARFGPKHTMIISNVAQIINASMLLTVPSHHWHIALLALPFGMAQSMFFISYHVSFSKIKHTAKAGAELGHMQIFEKIGFMLGPLIGGVAGTIFGSQYIFIFAAVLLIVSLWPLFLSSEPVKTRQKLNFKTLPITRIKRDLIANTAMVVENTLCLNAWPFYVALFVLSGSVYAQLGTLTAFGVLVAMLSARVMGRISDTKLARPVMHAGLYINALLHMVRMFVNNIIGVLMVNVGNEIVTTGYRMPFMKGLYAASDDLPGYRIVYFSTLECFGSIVRSTVWFFLAVLATAMSLKSVLLVSFVIAATASILVTKERFAVYNNK